MTIREKLADWISGGALSRAKVQWIDTKVVMDGIHDSRAALWDIANATASGKSGTAKKIHRMAMEALK